MAPDFETALRDRAVAIVGMVGVSKDITERRRVEAERRQTGALLRAIADGTTDAVFVKDRQGRYLLFNEAAAGFVGKPVADVLGRDDTEFFDPDSARLVMDRDRRVMATGTVETEEETLTADGVTRTYLATKGPYRDDKGNVAGVLGISRDITERKRAEQRLKTQHAVVSILAQAPDLREAALKLLRIVCETTGWDVGDLWVVDRHTNVLSCVDLWHVEGMAVAEFSDHCRRGTFARGVGLPGRVWATGQSAWIIDITKDTNFPRAGAAASTGLHGGFGFPIKFGNDVLGVEFWSCDYPPPGGALGSKPISASRAT